MRLAIHLVCEGNKGSKDLLAARLEDPAFLQQAVELSVRQAFEEAQTISEFDPLLGEIKEEEAQLLEKVLHKWSPPNAAAQPLLARPLDRDPGDDLLFLGEEAKKLGVKTSWIYAKTRLTGRDRMPHTRIAGRLRFNHKEVLAWCKDRGA